MSDFNVMAFGAKGDGVTDDTAAIRAVVAEAGKVNGTVFFPTGKYLSGEIRLSPGVVLKGETGYSYRESYGSILVLRDDSDSACLVNMTDSYGARVHSLCLTGRADDYARDMNLQTYDNMSQRAKKKDGSRIVHGIMLKRTNAYSPQEDAVCVDNCRVEFFTGDGIHFERIWCFSVRHTQMFFNKGAGIWCQGWDGFVIDCWMSCNTDGGFVALEENSANTLTGNRIEWNPGGGIVIKNGLNYNITGNYIDRSGNAGIRLEDTHVFAISGNVVYRSGKPEWGNDDDLDSCHIRLERCNGITVSGNSLTIGGDDGGRGMLAPYYGMVIRHCTDSVIGMNSLHKAALKELIVEQDNTGCIIKDNAGRLATLENFVPAPSSW